MTWISPTLIPGSSDLENHVQISRSPSLPHYLNYLTVLLPYNSHFLDSITLPILFRTSRYQILTRAIMLTGLAHQTLITLALNGFQVSLMESGSKCSITPLIFEIKIGNHLRFMENGYFTDVTVIYGEERHRLHKLLLCNQSSFFTKVLVNFKPSLINYTLMVSRTTEIVCRKYKELRLNSNMVKPNF